MMSMTPLSMTLALTRDYSRRVWLPLLLIQGIIVLGPLFFLGLIAWRGWNVGPEFWQSVGQHFNYMGLLFLAFAFVAGIPQTGIAKHARTLPITSAQLMVVMMILGAVVVVLMSVITTVTYRELMHFEWPMLGPTLFFVVSLWMGQALIWNLHAFGFRRLFAAIVVVILMVGWFVTRYYPEGLRGPLQRWESLSPLDVLVLVAVAAIAFYLAIRSFARFRCGEAQWSVRAAAVRTWFDYTLRGTAMDGPPEATGEEAFDIRPSSPAADLSPDFASERPPREFPSPAAALAWFDWRSALRPAMVTIFLVACVPVVIFLFTFTFDPNADAGNAVFAMLFSVSFIVAMGIGLTLGQSKANKGSQEMLRYLATLPISDADLTRAIMRSTFKAAVISWCFVLASVLLCAATRLVVQDDSRFESLATHPFVIRLGVLSIPVVLAALFILLWAVLGTCATIGWIGWEKAPTWATALIPAVPVCLVLLQCAGLPEHILTMIALSLLLIITFATVVGTVYLFALALRKQLIQPASTALLASLWILAGIVCWIVVPGEPIVRSCCCGLLGFAVMPCAGGPLALSCSRHR